MGAEFGRPQQGYNPSVHGPYHPGRWYGKADTHWKDVKLAELPAWLTRRSVNPIDMWRAGMRSYYRWQIKWMQPKKPSAACLVHYIGTISLIFYALKYDNMRRHRQSKYH